jgi:hypothetical protein
MPIAPLLHRIGPIIHAISGLPEIATIDAQVGYSRPEWLASLAPQDDGSGGAAWVGNQA